MCMVLGGIRLTERRRQMKTFHGELMVDDREVIRMTIRMVIRECFAVLLKRVVVANPTDALSMR